MYHFQENLKISGNERGELGLELLGDDERVVAHDVEFVQQESVALGMPGGEG